MMVFITKYKNYFIIILISLILGLGRWLFLNKDFPLFDSSDIQKKAMRIKNLSKENIGSSIDFELMKEIVSDKIFPILDARDIESYNEGHITGAINFDSELLMDGGHSEKDCFNKTSEVIKKCFDELILHKVDLKGIILKPNMILAGTKSKNKISNEEVAKLTLECLKNSVPSEVPGIAFLSGGHSEI